MSRAERLECTCGMPAKQNKHGVFCTSGTYLCEAETRTIKEWNERTVVYWRKHAPNPRKAAKSMVAEAKRVEGLMEEYENRTKGRVATDG